ncbi:transcriptional activator RfaH, partial [Gammaproteobacteria bacterium]|nr:transcriptional activator RfaH [Gammaproteobacteria bacterium]
MNDDYKWYVVRTKPRSEYRAKRELSNQGYESYLPEMQISRLIRGRESTVTEPLFSRYLFVRLSRVDSRWTSIRSTRGVEGVVAFGDGEPLPVSDYAVDTIRDNCLNREIHLRFKPGDNVRILSTATRESGSSGIWGQLESFDG